MFEDGNIVNELLIERLNYFIYVILLLIGLYGMIAKKNLIKKLIGMSIFQTAIILFYVSVAVKEGATIPIYLPEHDPHGQTIDVKEANSTDTKHVGPSVLKPELVKDYANPLPHVLMLTAIVVGVATLGLALALCQRIFQGYGTIEEDELLAKMESREIRSKALSVQIPKEKNKNSKNSDSSSTPPKSKVKKSIKSASVKTASAKKNSSKKPNQKKQVAKKKGPLKGNK